MNAPRQLRPYQHLIERFPLQKRRVNIWAGMGLGKTVSVSTTIASLALIADDALPVLVVAPTAVARTVWKQEIMGWDHLKHLKVNVMLGTATERRAALRGIADVYVINYENLQWLERECAGGGWPFRTVIADESTFLKSFRLKQGGARAASIARFAHSCVKRWINLTGTPAENGLIDLWGQAWFLDKGERLGASFTSFEERWFYRPARGDESSRILVPHDHANGEIKDLLSDITLCLESKDQFQLPDQVNNTVFVELPPKARKVYDAMQKDFFAELASGGAAEAAHAAAKSQKLLQIASGSVFLTDDDGNQLSTWEHVHDEKIDALRSIVEEAAGMPVLVSYTFTHERDRILKAFPGAKHLDGKQKTIDDWNAGKIPILVAHPKSAGHGLNLQHGGNILVFFGHWWALGLYLQIIERIGPVRQLQSGYDRPVFVHHIVARGTVDELVMASISSKRGVLETLMEAMKRGGV